MSGLSKCLTVTYSSHYKESKNTAADEDKSGEGDAAACYYWRKETVAAGERAATTADQYLVTYGRSVGRTATNSIKRQTDQPQATQPISIHPTRTVSAPLFSP